MSQHGQEHQHQSSAQGHPMAHEAGQAPIHASQGRRQVLDQGEAGRHQSGREKRLQGPFHPSLGEVVGHQQDDGEQPELVDGWQSDSRLGRGQPGDQGGPDEEQQRQLEGREMKGRAAIQEAVQQEPRIASPRKVWDTAMLISGMTTARVVNPKTMGSIWLLNHCMAGETGTRETAWDHRRSICKLPRKETTRERGRLARILTCEPPPPAGRSPSRSRPRPGPGGAG